MTTSKNKQKKQARQTETSIQKSRNLNNQRNIEKQQQTKATTTTRKKQESTKNKK